MLEVDRLTYLQSGEEVPVFYGAGTQRGHGLGSILDGLFRAVPFLSCGAKIIGRQAMNVASYITDGKSFQDSAKSRLKKGIQSLSHRSRLFLSLVAE